MTFNKSFNLHGNKRQTRGSKMSEQGKKPVEARGTVGIGVASQGTVTVIDSLNQGYDQLSGTFTVDQKRIADATVVPYLQALEKIAENQEEEKKILEEQNRLVQKQIAEGKKSQRNANAIAVFAIAVLIIITIIGWVLRL
jgi:hypothetical protein